MSPRWRWYGENTADETIEQTESYWKSKLLSREFGLDLG